MLDKLYVDDVIEPYEVVYGEGSVDFYVRPKKPVEYVQLNTVVTDNGATITEKTDDDAIKEK